MKRLTAIMLGLCAIPAAADDGRILLRLPEKSKWVAPRAGRDPVALAKGIPGRATTHLVLHSKHGRLLAEVVLVTGVPGLRPDRFGGSDDAIEPLPRRADGLLDLHESLVALVARIGTGSVGRLRGKLDRTPWASLWGIEGITVGGPVPRLWIVGVQYVKLAAGRNALLVYRILPGRRNSRSRRELNEILRSAHIVRPA